MANLKQACEATGGRWDEATKKCIGGKTSPEREEELFGGVGVEPEPPKPTKIIYSEEGKATGVEQPSGRTLLGIQPRDVAAITKTGGGVTGAGAIPGVTGGVIGATEFAAQEQEQRRLAGIATEQERLIAEETPVRRELSPELSGIEKVPVLGGTFGAIKDVLQNVVLKTVPGGKFKEAFKDNLDVASPEQLRSLALTEIERQEIEKGLTASEQFGALIEGIPIVGSLATKYAGGLIETPSENAAQVKKSILKEKRRIANIETNVKLGYTDIPTASAQLDDIENSVQRFESRLKMLINNSPELKFNSDLVNTYEVEILLTREKILQGRQNVLTGITNDPSEITILQRLLAEGEVEEEQ